MARETGRKTTLVTQAECPTAPYVLRHSLGARSNVRASDLAQIPRSRPIRPIRSAEFPTFLTCTRRRLLRPVDVTERTLANNKVQMQTVPSGGFSASAVQAVSGLGLLDQHQHSSAVV